MRRRLPLVTDRFGQPHVRDLHDRCDSFEPPPHTKEIGWRGEMLIDGRTGFGTCATNGHYLCGSCRHNDGTLHRKREEEERYAARDRALRDRAKMLEGSAFVRRDADGLDVAADAWTELAIHQGSRDGDGSGVQRCRQDAARLRAGWRIEVTMRGQILWHAPRRPTPVDV